MLLSEKQNFSRIFFVGALEGCEEEEGGDEDEGSDEDEGPLDGWMEDEGGKDNTMVGWSDGKVLTAPVGEALLLDNEGSAEGNNDGVSDDKDEGSSDGKALVGASD